MHEKRVILNDREHLLKVNMETGEVLDVNDSRGGNPNMIRYTNGLAFAKYFTETWAWLYQKCSKTEYCIAQQMHHMAKRHNNSLAPLNDSSTMEDLAEHFGLNRNLLSKALKKLFRLGVYATFRYCNEHGEAQSYWVLNPDLAFNGAVIDRGIVELFIGTALSIAVRTKSLN